MGDVYEAEHVALRKRVVVKLLHLNLASNPALVDRMRLEGQAMAAIRHPNVVEVTDLGETAEGRPYLAMEKLEGRTLRAELKARGVLPAEEAIELSIQLLEGLSAVHEAGLVHRDVKLDNLFLCNGGALDRPTLKLLDFGVAKVVETAVEGPMPLAFPTAEGVAVGTPRFFSPEQARGEAVDGRSDIYAAGLVLYELLAGRGPFAHAKGVFELARAHTSELPEPASRFASQAIPAALDAIILRALAKLPGDRFASAGEFAQELRRIAAMKPATEPRWLHTEPVDPAAVRRHVQSTVAMHDPVRSGAVRRAVQGTVRMNEGLLASAGRAPLAGVSLPSAPSGAPLPSRSDLAPERSPPANFMLLAAVGTLALAVVALVLALLRR